MRKYLILILLMSLQMLARGQSIAILDSLGLPHPTEARSMRYWFDDDNGGVTDVSDLNGRYTIDASSLMDGLHAIHYQIVDSEDKVGPAYSCIFLKLESAKTSGKAATLRYWFDDRTDVMTCNANVGMQTLDVSDLLDGLHTIHYQVVNEDGKASYIASNIFLKLESVATAGKAATLRYWFDDCTDVMTCNVGMQTLDVSGLLDGLHTIHYQVVNEDGKASYIASNIFLKLESTMTESEAATLRYWFDDDTNVTTCNANVGVQQLDAYGLLDGLHTLHCQVVDTEGKTSYIASSIFLKMKSVDPSERLSVSKLIYWFDDLQETTTIEVTAGTQVLDASMLLDGLHTLHYIAVCNDGTITTAYSSIFLKMDIDTDVAIAKRMRYWFDDETSMTEVEVTTGTQTLDATHLQDGLHTVHCQLVDESGSLAIPMSSIFFKMTEDAAYTAQKLRYWFDDDTDIKTADVAGGSQMLDVSALLTGLHTLHYQLVDDKGNVNTPVSGIFFHQFDKVVESRENVITQYTYWMNDNSADNKKVKISNPSSPYQLITLLPMIKAPIRSSSFQFEVMDGTPMVYARNDLHIRFEDAAGYWVDDSRSFVDYSVSEAVTDVADLQPTQTFVRPGENGIKWFAFEAAPGDTIGFKSSQATSLQVFAPSGKEILSTMGDKSVQYSGTHTWETGTYYVAVHDVTGSKPSITLDYFHMDKYDVVDQDVRVVGNGGCSTITFQGNGFRDLYAVDLKDSKGNIIQSIDVGHESDAITTVTFDFTDTKLGKYNAMFHFTKEDKTFVNCITVEEAKEIELVNTVTFNGNFLLGREADFTLKVVNKSNMTAYSVPVQIEVRSGKSLESIKNIKVACNRFTTPDNYISLIDSIDPILKDLLTDALPKLGALSDFFVLVDEDGQLYYRAEYSMTLLPNSETVITTSVSSQQTTEVYYIVPSDWAALSMKPINNARRMARANGLDAICCNKERIKCVANIANLIGGFTPYGCATSIGNEIVEQTLEGMCPDEGQVKQSLNKKVKSIAGSIMNVLIDCVTGHFDDLAKGIRKALKGIEEQIANISKQISKLSQERDEAYQSYRYLQTKATEAFNNHDAEAYEIWMDQADEALKKGQNLDNEIAGLSMQKDDLLTQQATKNKDLLDCREGLSNAIKGIRDSMADMFTESSCYKAFKESKSNCPPPYPGGGGSTPVNSYDPNDIFGYVAESGCRYVGEEVLNLPYRIEFENDTTFATSAAHTVVVRDTLDAKVFDLASYQPTSIKIGDKDVQLKGDKEFVTTVDMRPEINAIAQVEGLYDAKKGIATWMFTSLDPMTMEPTDDIMQGFLPVNYDGRGIGEVAFNINRKPGLPDGTEIANKASIVFDSNDPILTPVWTNIVDAEPPTSRVCDLEVVSDTIVRVNFEGKDYRSGVWKYALYVQYGKGTSWNQVAETDTTCFDFRYYEDIDYGFCVLATDSAGNVEPKIIEREYMFVNGEATMIDAIAAPQEKKAVTNKAYDLSGRLIQEEGYRGIVIRNRRKLLKR